MKAESFKINILIIMKLSKLKSLTLIAILILCNQCNSQNDMNKQIDRRPAVAGQFYSANPETLKSTLKELFNTAKQKTVSDAIAIISPHAGYVFSGGVAASAFNQIDTARDYETIFVIGSSHVSFLNGASIYDKGNYVTPLGTVNVDLQVVGKLMEKLDFYKYDSIADSREHSLEVQLPFLQYIMKRNFKIVPIIIGTDSAKMCKKIAESLRPYFTSKNLFIISSDFAHYPSYNEANTNDKRTAESILTNSPETFLKTLAENEGKHIKNLATSACGWTSILTLLYLTENSNEFTYKLIDYKNSGDSKYGEKDRVVGYNAIAVSQSKKSETGFQLSDEDKKQLINVAKTTIEQFIKNNRKPDIDTSKFSANLFSKCGAFVTLHKKGDLRGCIGRFTANEPLYRIVQEMAIAASTQDHRFSKVTKSELTEIDIEISVLTPLKKISSIDEIEMGRHGIYIKKGHNSGTFLPQVGTETGWNKEEFLGHCSRDKAGIGWDGWKAADIFTYEALVFGENK